MKRIWVMIAAALVGACVSSGGEDRRVRLTRAIADDAAAFNEAYGQAVSAQILLNILRSRDRLPRHYLAMTGISDSPSWSYSQSATIGDVPLGDSASPWGIGEIGASRSTETRPSYAVQPFSADTLTRTAFEPTSPHIFVHYWRSGWPRDLLLLTMVEALEVSGGDGRTRAFVNEANTIFDDCTPSVDSNGCDFVRELRTFLAATEGQSGGGLDMQRGRALCGLVETYAPTRAVRPVTGESMDCDPVFAVGDQIVRLRLRSLDDMIYYVGELMRAGAMRVGPSEAIEAQVNVRAAGLRGGGRGVPLFRIVPASTSDARAYAAEVSYAGARYRAGPAIGRSCSDAATEGVCADTAAEGDRSSSVLSLIAEILALNQSPDSIRAPSRLIAE